MRIFEKVDITILQDLRVLDPSETKNKLSLLSTVEWPVYVFEYLPIAAIMGIMGLYHPGFYLPRRLTGFRLRAKGLIQEDEEKRRVQEVYSTR